MQSHYCTSSIQVKKAVGEVKAPNQIETGCWLVFTKVVKYFTRSIKFCIHAPKFIKDGYAESNILIVICYQLLILYSKVKKVT